MPSLMMENDALLTKILQRAKLRMERESRAAGIRGKCNARSVADGRRCPNRPVVVRDDKRYCSAHDPDKLAARRIEWLLRETKATSCFRLTKPALLAYVAW